MHGAWLVFKKEMVEFFKDRKTVLFTLVMPLVLYPVIFTMLGRLARRDEDQRRGQPSKVVLVDPGGVLRPALEADRTRFRLVERPAGDFLQAVADEKVDMLVEVDAAAAAARDRLETFAVKATVDDGTDTSTLALRRLREALKSYDEGLVKARLEALKAPGSLAVPTRLDKTNASNLGRQLAKMLGSFLPYVLLIVMYAGAMQHGAYLSAGERERGTLLSLLATRLPRVQIILGKQLALFALCLLNVAVSLASMALGMERLGHEITAAKAAAQGASAAQPASLAALADPSVLALCFVLLVPLGFFFTAVVLLVGTQARTTREAQTAMTPGIFVVIVLGVFSMAPGIEKMAALPYVPVLNVSLAIRKLFAQQGNPYEYAVALAMTLALAALMTWQSSRVLSRESALFKGGD